MNVLARAIEISLNAHRGQKDRAGKTYILHPLRVMMKLESEVEMIVAVLHDVVEDSHWTIEDLRKEGFPKKVLQAVDSLTRREGEDYFDFIKRVKEYDLARKIKLADLEDNMDIRRLKELTPEDFELLSKYHKAWKELRQERHR